MSVYGLMLSSTMRLESSVRVAADSVGIEQRIRVFKETIKVVLKALLECEQKGSFITMRERAE